MWIFAAVDTDPDKVLQRSLAAQARYKQKEERMKLKAHARLTHRVEATLLAVLAMHEMTLPLSVTLWQGRGPSDRRERELREASQAVIAKWNAKTPNSKKEYCLKNISCYVRGVSYVSIELKDRKLPA